jgi:hypothetical protein
MSRVENAEWQFKDKIHVEGGMLMSAISASAGGKTLTAADSGKTIHLGTSHAAYTLTLPANAPKGVYYKFLYTGNAAAAVDITLDTQSNTNFFLGGLQGEDTNSSGDSNAVIVPNGSSNSKVALKTLQIGTWIDCYADGTNWTLAGAIYGDTATFAVFADQ